jgi:biotin-(acetyl-CoA carboxylase) ligase
MKQITTGREHPYNMDKEHRNKGSVREDVRNSMGDKKDVIIEGVLSGIDRDGALLVLEQGKTHPQRIISGEVVFLRSVGKGGS